MNATDKINLELTNVIRAKPDTDYQAVIDPAQMSIWFTTHAQADLRLGGRYSNADGDQGEFLALELLIKIRKTYKLIKTGHTAARLSFNYVSERQQVKLFEYGKFGYT